MADRINQAEFARQCGVSKMSVSKWVKKGVITVDAAGLLDPVAARAAVLAASNPAHSASRGTLAAKIAASSAGAMAAAVAPPEASPESGQGTSRYMVAKATREEWEAQRAELNYKEQAGQLVRTAVVKAAFFGLARQAQEALRTVPDHIAPALAAETDPHQIRVMLDAELRHVMAIIADATPFEPKQ